MMRQGSILALTGKSSEATEMLISGIAAYRTTGATLRRPFHLPHLARAHAELGQFEEACATRDKSLFTSYLTAGLARQPRRPTDLRARPGTWPAKKELRRFWRAG
jgi:hypothetical protein